MNRSTRRPVMAKRLFTVVNAALLLLVFQTRSVAQTKQKDALDSKTYTVEITEEKEGGKPGKKPYADEFSFKGGKFRAKIATDNGFASTVYEATMDSTTAERPIDFTIEAKNADTQERFSCEGTVKGEKIEGTAYYIKKGKTKMTYKFEGELKGKKPAPKKPAGTKPEEKKTEEKDK